MSKMRVVGIGHSEIRQVNSWQTRRRLQKNIGLD